ncbi:hypothetical protein BFJ72_g3060 [Fusarium proliferatum]|uniref:Pyruvate carboxyltransferase domain-containing protein n=1 Tax=Gibberella intermedia TaxID=948311 RepID=A0A420TXB9_GIBIN|nr:hypothetical protein BFJ72_g3060 [Fusarium proliferatum]
MSISSNTATNPYSSVSDLLSNVRNFKIIESTLREGEQFANAYFSTETKIKIGDGFGVDYLELTNPAASPQSRDDCEAICKLGLKDAKLACDCGVDGVDVVIGTSQFLREHSLGGKNMTAITKQAIEVIEYIKSRGCEDLVRTLRGCVSTDIEVHFHDDTGCAVANAFTALEAGATHVDTSVLGLGERNGITPLGALMARMMPTSRDYILSKYKLQELKKIEDFVAECVEVNVPFNNPVTGFCAFTHKAGIHAKAILNDPSTYEILKPEDFGLSRQVILFVPHAFKTNSYADRWNAIKSRVDQLGLKMTDAQVKECTAKLKSMADLKVMTLDESDALIRSFHLELQNGA